MKFPTAYLHVYASDRVWHNIGDPIRMTSRLSVIRLPLFRHQFPPMQVNRIERGSPLTTAFARSFRRKKHFFFHRAPVEQWVMRP